MKLLIDENLPLGLGADCGCPIIHATQLGERLSDEHLWSKAAAEGFVIVTKATDFFDRLVLLGPPPKVVWMRTGNLRRREVESFFSSRWSIIANMLEDSDLVEVFDDHLEAIRFHPHSKPRDEIPPPP